MVVFQTMEGRTHAMAMLRRLLSDYPVVAIVGRRQVGKTTLAAEIAKAWNGDVTRFNLERAADVGRLSDLSTSLEPLRGLVVIDEVQHREALFPTLRVLADRKPRRARFLILGSASPGLLRQSDESLAGRIAYFKLDGFGVEDVRIDNWRRLWLRGGFPLSYLARNDGISFEWREQLIATYLWRDLPDLGIRLEASTLERFWAMLAHYNGQTWNCTELARSFGVSDQTIRRRHEGFPMPYARN